MMVTCTIEECELENDVGMLLPSVIATCNRCGHTTESFGVSDRSIKRCLALMSDECPENEDNFYDQI